ncbi:MAG: sensor histidine kinase [Nitriliruptorales bacterium]|nr:sensor histidine kinase [Nitriliruptorales bacterium]
MQRVTRAYTDARTWGCTFYLALSLPLGLCWFVALVSGLGALVIPPIGFVAAAATVMLARQGAGMERGRLGSLLGVPVPAPYRPPAGGSPVARLRHAARDPATWRDLGYLLLLGPVGVISGALALLWISVPVALTYPAWYPALPLDLGLVLVDSAAEAWIVALIALLLMPALPWIVRAGAVAHGALTAELLGPTTAALRARVDVLSESRSRAVEAAAAERRRIERDLHDGAQQRLVALAMELGRAKAKLASDPEGARELVERAHEEAKRALVELRDLARGVHPAVLTDRGLDAAVSALAARSPVPVEVAVALPRRLPAEIEAVAYFLIAESLTNVTRHSGAGRARVTVATEARHIIVEVSDDGRGGAEPGPSTGLRGLADRVAAIDGRLRIDSPRGGGTLVRAELPWSA